MTDWQKKYRWTRTIFYDELPTERERQDYSGFDGDQYIGRIFLDVGGPKDGQWRWAAGRPENFKGEPVMPHAGYKPTAAEAAQTVEDYWDRMKARIG